MSETSEPSINIVVNAKGVKVVQFCGEGWDQEEETGRIYDRIKHLIQQMDRVLRMIHANGPDVVQ